MTQIIEYGVVASCLAIFGLLLYVHRNYGRTVSPDLVDAAALTVLGTATAVLVGPGPAPALILGGLVAMGLYLLEPRGATIAIVATATAIATWQAVASGICQPPLRGIPLLVVVTTVIGVPLAIRRYSLRDFEFFDPRNLLALYAAMTFSSFLVTTVGELIVNYRPSRSWIFLLLVIPMGLALNRRNPAADLGELAVVATAVFLVGSRTTLAVSTGVCSDVPNASLITTAATLVGAAVVLLATGRRREWLSPFDALRRTL